MCSPLPLTFYCRWDTLFREIASLSEDEPIITEPGDIRTGHVRINACGQRIVGWVDLPKTEFARCSGLLNDPDVYLMVKRESGTGGQSNEATAIHKESISYIEIVGEELTTRSWSIPSTFEPVVIELRSPDVVLRGEIFVLADSSVLDSAERYPVSGCWQGPDAGHSLLVPPARRPFRMAEPLPVATDSQVHWRRQR